MPAPDYNPLSDPWYGPTGNGPSASPPSGGGGGDVDLSGIESRLTSVEGDVGDLGGELATAQGNINALEAELQGRIPVYIGSVPAEAADKFVLFEPGSGTVDVSVEDGS